MKRVFLCLFFISRLCTAQVTTDPIFPVADQLVTISIDVSNTALDGYSSDLWLWTWLDKTSGDIDAPTNINPATSNQSAALMTRSESNDNVYSISFTPTTFFNVDKSEIEKIGLLLKGQDWSDGQTPDYSFDVLSNQFAISIIKPKSFPLLVNPGESISIEVAASEAANITLKVDDILLKSVSNATSLDHSIEAASEGIHEILIQGNNGTDQVEKNFSYTVRSETITEARPQEIIDGINYHSDKTKVTLSLLAPMKSSVYVVGKFSDWKIDPNYQLKKDGEHFWIELQGLSSGQEYAFQYLVDESIWIADPYADKVLDPDDQWIPNDTYANLLDYPEEALHSIWYENRTSIFQTNQSTYNWKNTSFKKPEKEDLVIYELLVRDFLGENQMNYQSLIDTLNYIKTLGVNAIELMPIIEFGGNDSWGYNPTFMFAVDKAYGSKNDLKAFVDAAHGKGLAVILDMVMNQNDIPSPYAQMYFDFDQFKPTEDNPWFNVEAKHPFNVFSDINHESTYTQIWLDSINHYWLNEFHFDGFRFDLSKGFTQTDAGGSVSNWGKKDESRITLLKRMADEIWSHSPDAYVILEHFADNEEEKILADYGMMLWGNGHFDFNDAARGIDKSLAWSYYKERDWSKNALISYIESHDEERMMYELLNSGKSSGSYNIRNINTAIQRLKLSAVFFLSIPGPKMIWQWQEFGYDVSINENGRTGRKPTKWEYLNEFERKSLFLTYKELIKLRNQYEVFSKGDFTWSPEGTLKSIHISNTDTSFVVIGNFDISTGSIDPAFQHTGVWYDFITGAEFQVSNVNEKIKLQPGEFHIYSNRKLHAPEVGIITAVNGQSKFPGLNIYPNPVSNKLNIKGLPDHFNAHGKNWEILNLMGQVVDSDKFLINDDLVIDVTHLPMGPYVIHFQLNDEAVAYKFLKK